MQALDVLPTAGQRNPELSPSIFSLSPGTQGPAVETCVSIYLTGGASVWKGVFVKLRKRSFDGKLLSLVPGERTKCDNPVAAELGAGT